MPFSNQSSLGVSAQPLPVLQERYALRRCMAETALGKLYWAEDLKESRDNNQQTNILVFTLSPELTRNTVFEQAFGHALSSYQKPAPCMPHVSDDGKTPDGLRWMVIRNITGMLLSERLAELDMRGMPPQEALDLLGSLAEALNCFRPEGIYGFMEPGSVLLGEKGPFLLAAPVVTALRGAYHSAPAAGSRHTLHSSYISPEVLLGDRPTPQDDTFSIACIAYHLLQGESAYNRHSTLEAAVRGLAPVSIRKLRPEAWLTLQQGLALQRDKRQKDPAILLRNLRRKQKKKLMLPIAALVAATAVAVSTYHLLTNWNKATEPAEQQETQPQSAPPPADEGDRSATDDANNLAASAAPATEIAAPAEPTLPDITPSEPSPALSGLDTLLEQAAQAIQDGKLLSDDPAEPAAIDHLRKIVSIDPENETARELLLQVISDQHSEAAALLAAEKAADAKALLETADKLITEFTLAPSLKRQVELETAVSQQQRQQTMAAAESAGNADTQETAVSAVEAQFLERAREAIAQGNLTEGDENGESAAAYLDALLTKNPDHPEALKLLQEVATQQQEQALAYLRKRDTDNARIRLDASQRLIGKYRLEDLVGEQITLEKRFRETQTMGIFPTEQAAEPASANTTTTGSAEPATPTPASVAPTAGQQPDSTEAELNRTVTIPPPVDAPVEVRVSPDLPIESTLNTGADTALPPTAILPPSGAPEPAAIAEPMPIEPNTSIFQVPPPGGNNNGDNTFVPDVPELIEVPLEVITDGLPNGESQ